jgi:hypothetical protein
MTEKNSKTQKPKNQKPKTDNWKTKIWTLEMKTWRQKQKNRERKFTFNYGNSPNMKSTCPHPPSHTSVALLLFFYYYCSILSLTESLWSHWVSSSIHPTLTLSSFKGDKDIRK